MTPLWKLSGVFTVLIAWPRDCHFYVWQLTIIFKGCLGDLGFYEEIVQSKFCFLLLLGFLVSDLEMFWHFGPDGGRFEVVVDAKMGIISPKINILAALYAPYLFCYYRINNWARTFCAFPSSPRPTNSKRFKINSIKIGMKLAHPTPVLNFVLLPFSYLLPCFNERLPV